MAWKKFSEELPSLKERGFNEYFIFYDKRGIVDRPWLGTFSQGDGEVGHPFDQFVIFFQDGKMIMPLHILVEDPHCYWINYGDLAHYLEIPEEFNKDICLM